MGKGGEVILTRLDLHELISRQCGKSRIELCVIAFIIKKIMFAIIK